MTEETLYNLIEDTFNDSTSVTDEVTNSANLIVANASRNISINQNNNLDSTEESLFNAVEDSCVTEEDKHHDPTFNYTICRPGINLKNIWFDRAFFSNNSG